MNLVDPKGEKALQTIAQNLAAGGPTRDSLRQPQLVEAAGEAVAEVMRAVRPDVVLSWDDLDDAMLAHVIARTLGVPTALVYEPAEGLVELTPPLPSGSRVAFFSAVFDRHNSLQAPAALIGHRDGVLVGIFSILGSGVARDELPAGTPHTVLIE